MNFVGPPLPPGVRTSLVSAIEIQLEWDEPFTSQGYPILNYTVVETEVVSGRRMQFISSTLNHYRNTSSVATQCIDIEFAVIATNSVGDSNATTVVTGFPIGNGSL